MSTRLVLFGHVILCYYRKHTNLQWTRYTTAIDSIRFRMLPYRTLGSKYQLNNDPFSCNQKVSASIQNGINDFCELRMRTILIQISHASFPCSAHDYSSLLNLYDQGRSGYRVILPYDNLVET